MAAIIAQLVNLVGPIIVQKITAHQAANGAMPTDAEQQAIFDQTVADILAEGDAWKAAHPQ